MDIEAVLPILAAIANWRTVVCAVAFSAIAWALVFPVNLLAGPQGLLLAISGLFVGAIWQERNQERVAKQAPDANTRLSVAVSGAALLGSIWGAASSFTLRSAIAGIILLAITVVAWRLHYISQGTLSNDRAKLCFTAAATGYCLALLAFAMLQNTQQA